jgi:hypothetical protein
LKIFLPIPIIYLSIIILTYFYGWNKIEPISWIITLAIPFIGSLVYLFKEEKNFDILSILKIKKEKIIKEESQVENFNINEIEEVENKINNLKKELTK